MAVPLEQFMLLFAFVLRTRVPEQFWGRGVTGAAGSDRHLAFAAPRQRKHPLEVVGVPGSVL